MARLQHDASALTRMADSVSADEEVLYRMMEKPLLNLPPQISSLAGVITSLSTASSSLENALSKLPRRLPTAGIGDTQGDTWNETWRTWLEAFPHSLPPVKLQAARDALRKAHNIGVTILLFSMDDVDTNVTLMESITDPAVLSSLKIALRLFNLPLVNYATY